MKKLKIFIVSLILGLTFLLPSCSYRCYSIMDQCERAAGRKPESVVVSDNTSTIPGRDAYYYQKRTDAEQRYKITKLKNR